MRHLAESDETASRRGTAMNKTRTTSIQRTKSTFDNFIRAKIHSIRGDPFFVWSIAANGYYRSPNEFLCRYFVEKQKKK